jgi:hypothetical protein
MSDVGSARKVKDQLKAQVGGAPWCAGIGVEREDGIGFIVRVSVRAGHMDEARAQVPERVGVVVVKMVEGD